MLPVALIKPGISSLCVSLSLLEGAIISCNTLLHHFLCFYSAFADLLFIKVFIVALQPTCIVIQFDYRGSIVIRDSSVAL